MQNVWAHNSMSLHNFYRLYIKDGSHHEVTQWVCTLYFEACHLVVFSAIKAILSKKLKQHKQRRVVQLSNSD